MTLMLNLKPTRLSVFVFAASLLTFAAAHSKDATAQSRPAAYGPGSYVQVGGTGSMFETDYGQKYLGGGALFLDAHLYRKVGLEAEARALDVNEGEGEHQTTYLIGPRISLSARRFRPYTKILIGMGQFYYPFHFAKGSYFVLAPGGGVDWHVGNSRLTLRVIDLEFQKWPWFSYGPLKPYGVSSGIAIRVF